MDVQRDFEMKFLLDNGDQLVGGDCDPDLRLHRVFVGAKERLDAQVPFDPVDARSAEAGPSDRTIGNMNGPPQVVGMIGIAQLGLPVATNLMRAGGSWVR